MCKLLPELFCFFHPPTPSRRRGRKTTLGPGVCQFPEGSGEQRKMEETGCEIICGARMTLVVKGQMRSGEDLPTGLST